MTALEEFEEIQKRMELFTSRFDSTIQSKRELVTDEKEAFNVELNGLMSKEQSLLNDIDDLQRQEQSLMANMSKDSEQLQLSMFEVDKLNSEKTSLEETKSQLLGEVDGLNTKIGIKTAELNNSKKNLSSQLKNDIPELIRYETYLGLKIDSIRPDLLKFVFNNIDPDDYLREISVELDVSEEDYKIGQTFPEINDGLKGEIEAEFNNHRELVRFLSQIRVILRDLL